MVRQIALLPVPQSMGERRRTGRPVRSLLVGLAPFWIDLPTCPDCCAIAAAVPMKYHEGKDTALLLGTTRNNRTRMRLIAVFPRATPIITGPHSALKTQFDTKSSFLVPVTGSETRRSDW